jgi:hypothetical protein
LQTIVIRTGGLLGSPDDYALRDFLNTSGHLVSFDAAKKDWLSCKDLSRALLHASDQMEAVAGQAIYVTNCRHNQGVTSRAIAKSMADLLNDRLHLLPLPLVHGALLPMARCYQEKKS